MISTPAHAYGDIEAVEEMKILDHFADLLHQQPNTQGYVIVYAGERSFKDEAARRLQCYTRYLTGQKQIKRQQFTTINGGYRESREVELYITHKDGPTLLPLPTVRPSRVKIIADEKAPSDVFSLCTARKPRK